MKALLVVAICAVMSAATWFLAPLAWSHEHYVGLIDGGGRPCCNGVDCKPVEMGDARLSGDVIEVRDPVSGRWLPVSDNAINVTRRMPDGTISYDVRSPDARMHACILGRASGREVWCLILPGML